MGNFLTNLFSGGVQPNVNETLLRAYGKLPFYAEYRRLEVSPGTPTAFSQWMDGGRLAWFQAAGAEAKNAMMLSTRLVTNIPGTKDLVVASLWDSRDNVGRIFPFAFFVVCPPDALGADSLERWACATALFESFDALYAQIRALSSGGDFYKLFQKRALTIKPPDAAERSRITLELAAKIDAQAWFAAAKLDPATSQEWFTALVRRSGRWGQQPADIAQLALSCPLAAGTPFDAQVAMWLRWLEPLARTAGRSASIFAPGRSADAAATGRVHFIFRDLLPADFQLLTSQAGEYGFTENLAKVAPLPAPGTDSVVGDLPQGSLLSWLAAQSHRLERRPA